MQQTWRRLTFLHWPYPPDQIRGLIPAGLQLDTFDNAAWIGLVPFEIFDFPGIPHFPETNLRTYVIGPGGAPAVWFFSLEAARVMAVVGARLGYHLPYFWAKMRVTSENGVIHYQSRRHWPHDPHAVTDIRVQPGALFQPGELSDLDHFLTARFQLYAASRAKLHRAQIEHPPWPLARASVLNMHQTLLQASALSPPQGSPIAHYSDELHVKIGFPSKLSRSRLH
jgi:uncharacterized protein